MPSQVGSRGRFGPFGGQYVPETLMHALQELETAYQQAQEDAHFHEEIRRLQRDYVGRPTPLYPAEHLSAELGGAQIFFKREDLCHTGAHKINNVIGQVLLAKRMGKTRVTAETGAGQHGVATATVAALVGLRCDVFMGREDIERQKLNVFRMQLLGARVIPVTSGTGTLKDAANEAIRDWVAHVEDTHYVIGSVVGPHPYPTMVRDFQRIIGDEMREESLRRFGRLPEMIVACVGGGSNSMGSFYPFLQDEHVQLVGVEAAGKGISSGRHAATLTAGSHGVLHGAYTYLLQDADGQVQPAYSVSAGLDYPGVGPEHAWLKENGRVSYVSVTDQEALDAFQLLAHTEGILPALESAHAIGYVAKVASSFPKNTRIFVCLSGRGDKDVAQVARQMGVSLDGTDL
ncbi:MAG: tryptophan synthase subunit beta [Firmicutes bacterium]|nr:tryptophan synthase subunit beta [Bacillota bacterium]